MNPPPTRLAHVCACLAALLGSAPLLAGSQPGPAGAGSDPFAPGLRWVHAAAPATPWIPAAVSFAADGEWVFAARAFQTPGLLLLASAAGGVDALLASDASTPAGAVGALEVRAPESDPTRLFSLARFDPPAAGLGGGGARLARVSAHDPVAAAAAAAGGAGFAPVWTYDPGPATTGGARLALDRAGTQLALALQDPATGTVLVDRLDPELGTLVARATLAGGTLRGFELADGGELLVAAGADLWVLDAAGATLHHETLNLASEAVALSADGGTLLIGGLAGSAGRVRVLTRAGSSFQESCLLSAGAGELPVRVAVARDGGTLAVAWWNAASGAATRLEVWDGSGAVLWNEIEQIGLAGGLQNYPQALVMTPDGERVALGLWGLGDASPEAYLLERGVDAPLLALDLGGSVRALALGPGGTRLAVALKHLHANQFGTTGEVRLYDTGERDLQLDGVPRAGGTLALVHRLAGALWTGFVLGRPATAPLVLPGVSGALLLDPGAPMFLFGALPDASGRSALQLALPPAPELIGLRPALQTCSLHGAGGALGWAFSAWLALPVVL